MIFVSYHQLPAVIETSFIWSFVVVIATRLLLSERQQLFLLAKPLFRERFLSERGLRRLKEKDGVS